LKWLALGGLIPPLVVAAVMLVTWQRSARSAAERGLLDTARALSLAVDREVSASIAVLRALAASEHLKAGRLPEFDRFARAVLTGHTTWENVVLFDPSGRQLLNLRLKLEAVLPPTTNRKDVHQAAHARAPVVSDLFQRAGSGPFLVGVYVPVLQDGVATHVLGASIAPEALSAMLRAAEIPPDSVASLLDRRKVIMAQTRAGERFVGQTATPDLVAQVDARPEGIYQGFTRGGTPVYAAFTRSALTGWTVALGVPVTLVDAPFRRSLGLLAVLGLLLVVLGIAAARAISERVSRSILLLSGLAEAVARGEEVRAPPSPVAEVNDVARALETAGRMRARIEAHNLSLLAETERRRLSAESLAEVGRLVSLSLEPAQVGRGIVDAVCRLLGTKMASLFRVDPASGALLLVAGEGAGVRWNTRMEPGTGSVGLAVRERGPVALPDVLADPRIQLTAAARADIEASGFRAVLAVPLLSRGEPIGALAVGDVAGRLFSQEEIRLVQSFSDQAVIALENARLYAEATERRREAEALAEVARALTASLDFSAVAGRIVESVMRLFAVPSAGFRLLQPGGFLAAVAADASGAHAAPGDVLAPGMGISGRVIAEDRPIWCQDLLSDPAFRVDDAIRHRLSTTGLSAFLGVPLRVRGQVTGALTIADTTGREFGAAEAALLQAFADQAALALENARHYDEANRRRQEAEAAVALARARQARLEALVEVAREVSRIQPVESLLGRIAEACGRLLDSESVGFRLVVGDELVVAGTWGDAKDAMPSPRLKIGESLSGHVAASGEPLVVSSLLDDPRLIPAHAAADRGGHRARDPASPGSRPRPSRSRAARASHPEPRDQRPRRDAAGGATHDRNGQRDARRRVRPDPPGRAGRGACPPVHHRYRGRHGCRDPVAHLRAVLHDQRRGPRHGPRIGDGVRHRQAERRLRRDRERAREGGAVRRPPAADPRGGRPARGGADPGGPPRRHRDRPPRGG
jgi:GAF domain-containing protein